MDKLVNSDFGKNLFLKEIKTEIDQEILPGVDKKHLKRELEESFKTGSDIDAKAIQSIIEAEFGLNLEPIWSLAQESAAVKLDQRKLSIRAQKGWPVVSSKIYNDSLVRKTTSLGVKNDVSKISSIRAQKGWPLANSSKGFSGKKSTVTYGSLRREILDHTHREDVNMPGDRNLCGFFSILSQINPLYAGRVIVQDKAIRAQAREDAETMREDLQIAGFRGALFWNNALITESTQIQMQDEFFPFFGKKHKRDIVAISSVGGRPEIAIYSKSMDKFFRVAGEEIRKDVRDFISSSDFSEYINRVLSNGQDYAIEEGVTDLFWQDLTGKPTAKGCTMQEFAEFLLKSKNTIGLIGNSTGVNGHFHAMQPR